MPVIIAFVLIVLSSSAANAKCSKEEVCQMANKMNPFTILDKCPMAGPLIAEYKKNIQLLVKDLPKPQFVESGDGIITDAKNHLQLLL